VNIKKTIAPVIVSLCLIAYYLAVGIALLKFPIPIVIRITIIVASIVVPLVIVMVLVERLKEIKGGEEDDLGKY